MRTAVQCCALWCTLSSVLGPFGYLAMLVLVRRQLLRGFSCHIVHSEAEIIALSLIWDILWLDTAFAGKYTVLPANLC